jgi:hypothetical protein
MAPMTEKRREALETISRDSEPLRNLARRNRYHYLALVLEQAVHDARSFLMAEGYVPRPRGLVPKNSDLATVPLRLPRKHKHH